MEFLHGSLVTSWLAAISIPVIIHLLNRRRFRRVRWAAIEFILKAQKKNRRKIQLENLLLLILRTLLVLLLVLLIGRPLLSSGAFDWVPGAGESVERILLLDDSASLSEKLGSETSFGKARDAAIKFCRELGDKRSSDTVTILLSSRPEAPLAVRLQPGSEALNGVLKGLESWEASDTSADLVRCARTLVSGAAAPKAGAEGQGRRVLYALSDLRKLDWLGETGSKAQQIAECLRELQRDDDKAPPVLIVDAASGASSNVGVTDFQCLDRVLVTGVPSRFEAKVKNFGASSVSELQLTLKINDNAVPAATVASLAPGEERVVKLRSTFREAGSAALCLEIAGGSKRDDRLERDEKRYLAVEVLDGIRALIVDGEPSSEAGVEGETEYLSRAMAPPGDVISGATIKIVRREDLLEEDFSNFELIVLANLDFFPEERLVALESFIRRGGGLAIFLGDQIEVGRYQRDFWKRGLLPWAMGELGGTGDEEKAVRLASSEGRHPLLESFSGMEALLFGKVRFWRYFEAPATDWVGGEDEPERRPQVVLHYDDEARTPALVEKSFGLGRVLLFNTSADAEWTNWPRQISFVPMLQETMRFLAPSAAARRNLGAGEPLKRELSASRFERQLGVLYPKLDGRNKDEEVRPMTAQPKADGSAFNELVIADTRRAGIYSLHLKPRGGEATELIERYAVNMPGAEGDLTRVDAPRLLEALAGVKARVVSLATGSLMDLSEGKRRELWRGLLSAFLILLIAESALAWRAGHHRAAAPDDSFV